MKSAFRCRWSRNGNSEEVQPAPVALTSHAIRSIPFLKCLRDPAPTGSKTKPHVAQISHHHCYPGSLFFFPAVSASRRWLGGNFRSFWSFSRVLGLSRTSIGSAKHRLRVARTQFTLIACKRALQTDGEILSHLIFDPPLTWPSIHLYSTIHLISWYLLPCTLWSYSKNRHWNGPPLANPFLRILPMPERRPACLSVPGWLWASGRFRTRHIDARASPCCYLHVQSRIPHHCATSTQSGA